MELAINFEKLEAITRATTDPVLRLKREIGLRDLRKEYGPPQDGLNAAFEKSRRSHAELDASLAKLDSGLKKHSAFGFARIAADARRDAPRADRASELPSVDTRFAAFQPRPVTVQPGETVQAAALRAATESRETSEVETSPGQPWPAPNHRAYLRPPATEPYASAAKGTGIDELLKAANTPPREVESEIARFGLARISGSRSLRCLRCDARFYEMQFGPKPLERGREHFRVCHGPERLTLSATRQDLYRPTNGNRNL